MIKVTKLQHDVKAKRLHFLARHIINTCIIMHPYAILRCRRWRTKKCSVSSSLFWGFSEPPIWLDYVGLRTSYQYMASIVFFAKIISVTITPGCLNSTGFRFFFFSASLHSSNWQCTLVYLHFLKTYQISYRSRSWSIYTDVHWQMEVYRHLCLPTLPTTGVTCTRDDGVLPSNSATRDPEGWRWERVWRWWSNLVKTWKWIILETHNEWDQEKSLTGFNRCSFRDIYL